MIQCRYLSLVLDALNDDNCKSGDQSWADPEGEGTGGPGPLKNRKATKPAFNVRK